LAKGVTLWRSQTVAIPLYSCEVFGAGDVYKTDVIGQTIPTDQEKKITLLGESNPGFLASRPVLNIWTITRSGKSINPSIPAGSLRETPKNKGSAPGHSIHAKRAIVYINTRATIRR
jgi:hypothetical protein